MPRKSYFTTKDDVELLRWWREWAVISQRKPKRLLKDQESRKSSLVQREVELVD